MMYNPSAPGKKGSIFGLPYHEAEAQIVLIPSPMDVTASYGDGTSLAPSMILEESTQLDLSLVSIAKPWELKMVMVDALISMKENEHYRQIAKRIITQWENGEKPLDEDLKRVNAFCTDYHQKMEDRCTQLMNEGKTIAVVGGDHSSPLGLMKAIAKRKDFGILQIDAHMDLRKAYEGFTFSHASVMYNALHLAGVQKLTQVAIRDFCEEEEQFVSQFEKKIEVFYDESLLKERLMGKTWVEQVDTIVNTLPDNVYISLDIDGLQPSLCSNTGTPVPGGLSFNEVLFLLEGVAMSGKTIVGFDVCETGSSAWDANVSARLLYRLGTLTGVSQGLLSFR